MCFVQDTLLLLLLGTSVLCFDVMCCAGAVHACPPCCFLLFCVGDQKGSCRIRPLWLLWLLFTHSGRLNGRFRGELLRLRNKKESNRCSFARSLRRGFFCALQLVLLLQMLSLRI